MRRGVRTIKAKRAANEDKGSNGEPALRNWRDPFVVTAAFIAIILLVSLVLYNLDVRQSATTADVKTPRLTSADTMTRDVSV